MKRFQIMFKSFIISLFPLYRNIYNYQGQFFQFIDSILKPFNINYSFYWDCRFRLIPYIDFKIWKNHPEHPSNQPHIKEIIRQIYWQTGLEPMNYSK